MLEPDKGYLPQHGKPGPYDGIYYNLVEFQLGAPLSTLQLQDDQPYFTTQVYHHMKEDPDENESFLHTTLSGALNHALDLELTLYIFRSQWFDSDWIDHRLAAIVAKGQVIRLMED